MIEKMCNGISREYWRGREVMRYTSNEEEVGTG